MSKSKSWLDIKLDTIESSKHKNEMFRFTLLWSLFENKLLENEYKRYTSEKIESSIKKLKSDLYIEDFRDSLDYFKDRYKDQEKFNRLAFKKNDKKELVENVLFHNEQNIEDIVSALLIIVYRIRNNFFHGAKWQYELTGQYDPFENFQICNKILEKILEISKKEDEI